ncbi:MAG: hypothetical protein E3J23_03550 [Candidatus Stahlbacteria bacterium]|nr:MAG: hypothetical protein E3J23_03550 [Candidatus Stahlbacteria bacterium]
MKRFILAVIILSAFTSAQAVSFTLRLGIMGGLVDERAPDKKLGGGQLALDLKLDKVPIAFSISWEYHKKSPDAIHPYEIEGLLAVNTLYLTPVFNEKADVYLGGGIGLLDVPKVGDPDNTQRGILLDAVAGINYKAFWKIGFYVEGKYIYASKTVNNVKVIDFSDPGFMVGISLNFD